jgi:hypothetical protein
MLDCPDNFARAPNSVDKAVSFINELFIEFSLLHPVFVQYSVPLGQGNSCFLCLSNQFLQ